MDEVSSGALAVLELSPEQPARMATGMVAARQYTSLLISRMILPSSLLTRVFMTAIGMAGFAGYCAECNSLI
jgi:hypothetical protein